MNTRPEHFDSFRKVALVALLCLILLFLFTRLFQITDSLLYLNDMGRDSLVLLDWQTTGKPPLLGPQTSALPFNQSAFYFYILYPLFLLSHGSPFSALFTVDLFYLIIFTGTFLFLSRTKNRNLLVVFLLSLFLLIIQPQSIIQNRFVWNPSFVGPLILASFFFLYSLWQKFSWKKTLLVGLTLALAISLSYSIAPILIGFVVAAIVYLKKNSVMVGASLVGWLLFFNLPTLFFELRHHFLLTQMMLHQPKVKQLNTDLPSKVSDLLGHALTTYPPTWAKFLALIFILSMIIGFWLYQKKKSLLSQPDVDRQSIFFFSNLIFWIGLIINLISPIPILAHYVFGLITLGVIMVASLPSKLRLPVIIIFGSFWIYPIVTQQYFKPAERTVSQMQTCYQKFCQQLNEPVYVSLQSGILPFHNGPEHRYLLKQAGCEVKDIETDANAANKMAVVVESSDFSFGKTDYAELHAFQPTKQDSIFTCQPNLQIVTVSR